MNTKDLIANTGAADGGASIDATSADAAAERGLHSLRAPAPAGLAERTLVEVGLADAYATVDGPLGPMFVAWNGAGVSLVDLAGDETAFVGRLTATTGRPAYAMPQVPPTLRARIGRRIAGDRRADVPLDWRGRGAFERAVWSKALEIPRGEVRPYGWIAAEIGSPRAVRAVGTALGHNPIPLIVPCHRVVRSDGTIGQYSLGGAENKRAVLEAEGVDVEGLHRLGSSGVRYYGSDTTRIFCHPTCRHARRVTDRHRVLFESSTEAKARGYRPCHVCRPVAA